MKKLNGKVSSGSRDERAQLIGKPFRCDNCLHIEFKKGVEFGEELKCPKCEGTLEEMFLPN